MISTITLLLFRNPQHFAYKLIRQKGGILENFGYIYIYIYTYVHIYTYMSFIIYYIYIYPYIYIQIYRYMQIYTADLCQPSENCKTKHWKAKSKNKSDRENTLNEIYMRQE